MGYVGLVFGCHRVVPKIDLAIEFGVRILHLHVFSL